MDQRTNADNEGTGTASGRQPGGHPLGDLGPEMGRQIEELRGRLDEALDRAAELIRERPGTSLLVALGVGYLIGRIVRS